MNKKITDQNQSANSQMSLEKNTPHDRALKLVNYLCGLFPHYRNTIKSDYDSIVKTWITAIADLTDAQLRIGCKWCLNSGLKFCPDVPYFRFKCFGLIDSDEAFEIAKEDQHASPAIYGASCKISTYQWKNWSNADLRRRFLQNYAVICESIMNGAIIHVPEKVMQLENNYLSSLSSIKKTEKGIKQARALVELAKKIAAQKEAKYDKLHEVVRI